MGYLYDVTVFSVCQSSLSHLYGSFHFRWTFFIFHSDLKFTDTGQLSAPAITINGLHVYEILRMN